MTAGPVFQLDRQLIPMNETVVIWNNVDFKKEENTLSVRYAASLPSLALWGCQTFEGFHWETNCSWTIQCESVWVQVYLFSSMFTLNVTGFPSRLQGEWPLTERVPALSIRSLQPAPCGRCREEAPTCVHDDKPAHADQLGAALCLECDYLAGFYSRTLTK